MTRRTRGIGTTEEEQLEVGPLVMSVDRHEVTVNGEIIRMALRSFELLEFLMRNPDRVLTRGQILDRVWGPNFFGDSKTLDVHVKRLRADSRLNPHPLSSSRPCAALDTRSSRRSELQQQSVVGRDRTVQHRYVVDGSLPEVTVTGMFVPGSASTPSMMVPSVSRLRTVLAGSS